MRHRSLAQSRRSLCFCNLSFKPRARPLRNAYTHIHMYIYIHTFICYACVYTYIHIHKDIHVYIYISATPPQGFSVFVCLRAGMRNSEYSITYSALFINSALNKLHAFAYDFFSCCKRTQTCMYVLCAYTHVGFYMQQYGLRR